MSVNDPVATTTIAASHLHEATPTNLKSHPQHDSPTAEKSEDGRMLREMHERRSIPVGEGDLDTRKTAAPFVITSTPPQQTKTLRSLHSRAGSQSKLLAENGQTSGAGSPMMAKMYLLQRRQSSESRLDTSGKPTLLDAPLDPLLAPLDAPRPTKAVDPTVQHSAIATAADESNQKNALEQWDEIAASLKGKQLVIFLDYDGTLTPIVSNPAAAIIDAEQRQKLAALASKNPVAIVTGRKLETIKSFLARGGPLPGLEKLFFAGSHGFDIYCPTSSGNNKVVASEYLPHLAAFRDAAAAGVKDIAGALVEDNKFSISVHYRNVAPTDRPKLDAVVHNALQPYIARDLLRLTHGHEVHEIRANFDWHKGAAVNYLMQLMCGEALSGEPKSTQEIVPIYIGDDRTDEDAFSQLRAYRTSSTHPTAVAIFVRQDDKARPSAASHVLRSPAEVGQFLQKLAEL